MHKLFKGNTFSRLFSSVLLIIGSIFFAACSGGGDKEEPDVIPDDNEPKDYVVDTKGTYTVYTTNGLLEWAAHVRSGNYNTNCILAADIDLTGKDWRIVGNDPYAKTGAYKGTFDGAGHTIKGLSIPNNQMYASMFGVIGSGSVIKDLVLENVDISGRRRVGSITGWNLGGTITNCHSTGKVVGDSYDVGGLVGYSKDGTISNCYYSGTVNGETGSLSYFAGGIVGNLEGGSISKCYSTGYLKCGTAGGLVGNNDSGKITDSYSKADVDGHQTGGIAGRNAGIISDCNSSGTIRSQQPFNFQGRCGGIAGFNIGIITRCHSVGLIDGSDTGGIVSWNYNGGSITDSYSSSDVKGGVTGGIAGYNNGGSIENCYFIGTVTGDYHTGGLVGQNYHEDSTAIIMNCYTSAKVTGTFYNVGGLVGSNNAYLIACYFTGSVSSSSEYVGGIAGYNYLRDKPSKATIVACYSTGSVDGKAYVGGVVGVNECGTVLSCYSSGSLSGSSPIAGVVGYHYSSSSIINCYWNNTGTIPEYGVGGVTFSNDNATKVDNSDVTWSDAVTKMNESIQDWNEKNNNLCGWQFQVTDTTATPILVKSNI